MEMTRVQRKTVEVHMDHYMHAMAEVYRWAGATSAICTTLLSSSEPRSDDHALIAIRSACDSVIAAFNGVNNV